MTRRPPSYTRTATLFPYTTLCRSQESATADGSQEIVVTAAGFEQRIAEAPASISILTREQLETRPFTSLEDAVRNVEGVSVVGDSPNSTDKIGRASCRERVCQSV